MSYLLMSCKICLIGFLEIFEAEVREDPLTGERRTLEEFSIRATIRVVRCASVTILIDLI